MNRNKVVLSLMTFSNFMMLGVVNLSEIWSLIDEIVNHTSSIVGLVIMGITIAIAAYIGKFIKSLLENASKVR